MIESIFKFFGGQEQKQKVLPETFVYYTKKDPQTQQIQQQIVQYNFKKNEDLKNWKRAKVKSFDTRKLIANIKDDSFIDPDFPHTNASISDQDEQINFQWKRIPQIIKFCVYSSIQTFRNFQRISLSNKKLKQALLFIHRTHPSKFKQFLAHDCNTFGLYEFKLYKNGIIQNVVIDDYIPVVNGNLPLMMGPVADRQIFPILIEKAIAKICGGYDKIPQNLDELLEILFCGPLRKTKIQQLHNAQYVSQTIEKTLSNGGVAGFISKSEPKIRSFGMSQNQLYHVINKYEVSMQNGSTVNLYELVSEKKMSAWNGKFSHNDEEWEKVDASQRAHLFNQLKINKSFFMSGNDIPKIFDHLFLFQGTEINNKQWLQCKSQVTFPSFVTFQLSENDNIFLRSATHEPVRNSLILAKINGPGNYQFVKGAFHENAYMVELSEQLSAGKYVICSHHDWILQKSGNYNLFLSSNSHALLLPAVESIFPNFLENLLKAHCEKNKNKTIIPEWLTIKNCYSIGMMAKQTGFAFVDFDLTNSKYKQMLIQINSKILAYESWQILQPNANRYVIQLQKGVQQQLFLILKTHKYLSSQNVVFPSTAFSVKL